MTQSRQIQLFGFLGTSILILFIVIFLGKDFYALYLHYLSGGEVSVLEEAAKAQRRDPGLSEAAPATEPRSAITADKSEAVAAAERDDSVQPHIQPLQKSGEAFQPPAPVTTKREVKESVVNSGFVNSAVQEPSAAAPSETAMSDSGPLGVQKVKVVKVSETKSRESDVRAINHRFHLLLQERPFFHSALRLTDANRALLDRVADSVRALPFAAELVVEGHTAQGIAPARSRKMAKIVARYLRTKLPGLKIMTAGYANTYPISDDLKDPANTRIEIIVRRSGK